MALKGLGDFAMKLTTCWIILWTSLLPLLTNPILLPEGVGLCKDMICETCEGKQLIGLCVTRETQIWWQSRRRRGVGHPEATAEPPCDNAVINEWENHERARKKDR